MKGTTVKAKPFLKWAGGKTQLLDEIMSRLPIEMKEGKITRYIEPFIGSGAVMFELVQTYHIEDVWIWDINPELITVYQVVQKDVESLIERLAHLEKQFLPLEKEKRKEMYYSVRDQFNETLLDFDFHTYGEHKIERASQFIFLNKTCFNGLFRVNKKGEFNVPMGDYKNPTICDSDNLRAASAVLQHVNIYQGDYKQSREFINNKTFVYFDPPYRPLSTSSSFTAYSKFDFTDENQKELAQYYRELDKQGAFLMLSNSDPKNTDPNDEFFDELYAGFHIERVTARRNINSKGNSRGAINEILVTNYFAQ
ncbi:DNA adenine methylase [Anoxybacillus vitaminiphilus]|uniref:Site-specific DNA-methyltransferase (adenine-specific) n=1 Tax=Paranoxybacillus vitaminiphilus TaxID=581036 RepID=A0A327YM31_9BACL|nr:DNA adenine methylase [Anoxybacillus vitaminiphilus]RAK22058.1 DNA adenine methylase [Anoxybacillus vitaminiphilus]